MRTALPAPQPRPGVSEQPEDTTLQLAQGLQSFLSLSLTFIQVRKAGKWCELLLW